MALATKAPVGAYKNINRKDIIKMESLISNPGWIKTSNKFRRGHFLVFPKTYVLKCMF